MSRYIVLDTETTGTLDCPFMFDLGYAIVEDDEVLATRSLVISDYFTSDLMRDCYYADHIPQYLADIANGSRILVSLDTARNLLAHDCHKYGIHQVYAHNAFFDYKATANALRYRTCSAKRYFLPYGVEWCDSLRLARQVLKNNESYGEFCYSHGYLTKSGQRRYTAEVIYQWLTDNDQFTEAHYGLDDVLIEKDIVDYCLTHGATDGRLFRR